MGNLAVQHLFNIRSVSVCSPFFSKQVPVKRAIVFFDAYCSNWLRLETEGDRSQLIDRGHVTI